MATRTSKIGAAMVAAVLGWGIAGCSSSESATSATSSSAGYYSAPGGDQEVAASAAMMESAPASAAADAAQSGQGAPPPSALTNRQIVKTADLQIKLVIAADVADDDYEAAQQAAVDAAVNNVRSQLLGVGGFIADLQQSTGAASLVLRVPADQFDSFRSSAAKIGEVTSSTESASDVTDEYTDVTSRIATMQTSIERMRVLLAQATNVADIIAVESELSRREADLESLQGRQAVLNDQVSLSTISVSFTATRDAVASTEPVDEQGGFLGGLADGWDALTGFLGGVAVVLGALLPWVPLMLIVAAIAWLVLRRTRTRRQTEPGAPTGA